MSIVPILLRRELRLRVTRQLTSETKRSNGTGGQGKLCSPQVFLISTPAPCCLPLASSSYFQVDPGCYDNEEARLTGIKYEVSHSHCAWALLRTPESQQRTRSTCTYSRTLVQLGLTREFIWRCRFLGPSLTLEGPISKPGWGLGSIFEQTPPSPVIPMWVSYLWEAVTCVSCLSLSREVMGICSTWLSYQKAALSDFHSLLYLSPFEPNLCH